MVSPLKMLLIEICQHLIDFVSATLLVCVGVSGEINNGIKKESVGKDAARMWINDGIKMQNISHSLVNTMLTKMIIKKQENIVVTVFHSFHICKKPPGMKEEDEPEEEEEEELGHAETYAEYMPMKCK